MQINHFKFATGFLCLFTTLLFNHSFADDVQVEVIVFLNETNREHDNEWFRRYSETIELVELDDLDLSEELPVEEPAILPAKPVALVETADRLSDDPNYQVLTLVSWIQEPEPLKKSVPVNIEVEFPGPSLFPEYTLYGTAHLYEVQLLMQLELDLTYQPEPVKSVESVIIEEEISNKTFGEKFTLAEQRSVAIGEVHYFDHPRFGAIVTVNRLPDPEDYVQ